MKSPFNMSMLAGLGLVVLATACTTTTNTETLSQGPFTDSCTNGKCVDTFLDTQLGSCRASQRKPVDGLILQMCPASIAAMKAQQGPQASNKVDGTLTIKGDAEAVAHLNSGAVSFRSESNQPIEIIHSDSVDTAVVHFEGLKPSQKEGLYELRAGLKSQQVIFPDAERIQVVLPASAQGDNS